MKTPQVPPLAGMSPLGISVDVDKLALQIQMLTSEQVAELADLVYNTDTVRAGDLEHALSSVAQDAYYAAQEAYEMKEFG